MWRLSLKRITRIALITLVLAQSIWGAVTLELVSKPYTNAPLSFGDSLGVQLSGDGEWALITSSAEGLPRANSARPSLDVFLRNLATADTKLISRGRSGGGGSGPSTGLALSTDGRFALFSSDADDLFEGDTNNATDIFLYDRIQDSLTVVSQRDRAIGDADSTDAIMTPDGRFVLFQSSASNLGTNDVNDVPDLFVFDRESGSLKTVTEGLLGGQRRPKFDVSISADGRYVGFLSSATNGPLFDLGQTIPALSDPQVYLRDLSSGKLYWMTEQADHGPGRFASTVRLSTNGHIAFISANLDLGAASVRPSTYVYWIRIDPRLIMRLPTPADIADEAPRTVSEMVMTPDGQKVAYIVDHGSPGVGVPVSRRLYLFDVSTGQSRLLLSSFNEFFKNLAVSNDGKVITLSKVSADSQAYQLYRIDTINGALQLLSRNASSEDANQDAFDPVLSADGSMAAFVSNATNIGSMNPLAEYNIFAARTDGTEATFKLSGAWAGSTSSTPSGASRIAIDPFGSYIRPKPALSIDGSRVVFTSRAWNITAGDTNGHGDLFVKDLSSGEIKRIEILADRNLQVKGISRDASVIAFANHRLTYPTYDFELHAIDARSGRDLLDDLIQSTNSSFAPFTAAVSDSGQFMLAETLPNGGRNRTFYVLDLVNRKTLPLPITQLRVSSVALSSAGRYAILESQESRDDNVAGPNLIIDVATGTTNESAGNFVASTPDDAALLFTTASALAKGGDLFLFSPAQNASNHLASDASFPAMSFNGKVAVFNQQYSPAGGGSVRTRAFALNGLNGTPFPLGVRPDGKELRFDEAPSVSPDGRYIAFAMKRDNGAADSDYLDVYLYDGVATNLYRISQTANGAFPNGPSRSPTVAANGRVVFESLASDLVAEDHNLDFDVFVATVTAPDVDQDGLEDGWEKQNFGTLIANAGEDFDGDGFTNYEEWLAGTDPKSSESSLSVQAEQGSAGGTVRWAGGPGRRYQVQIRKNLGSGAWEDFGLPVIAISTNLSVRVDTTSNAFYRIRLVE